MKKTMLTKYTQYVRGLWKLLGLIGALGGLSACSSVTTFEQPDLPATMNPENDSPNKAGTAVTYYSLGEYQQDLTAYNSAEGVDKPNENRAKYLRNKMMSQILADIDYSYGQYKGKVHLGRATGETVTDAMSLGLTGAATVAGGPALKSILAAADTALKGTVNSYQKNLYAEKTTEILVASMDALHQAKETQIIKNMSLSTTDYPFGLARVDLIELFYSSTREAALCDLEKEAGKKAADAENAKDLAAAAKTKDTAPTDVTLTTGTTTTTSTSVKK